MIGDNEVATHDEVAPRKRESWRREKLPKYINKDFKTESCIRYVHDSALITSCEPHSMKKRYATFTMLELQYKPIIYF